MRWKRNLGQVKNKLFIALVFLSLCGCRNYESKEYIAIENEAINDIILQLIDYEIIKTNHADTNHLKLFLFSSLDTMVYDIDESLLLESVYADDEVRYERLKKELKKFAPFKEGKIKERTLDYKSEYSNMEVVLIPYSLFGEEFRENELGYLWISRICFNRRFDKGYLQYGFFCGEGCLWKNNIEIVKMNGKWQISEYFSGGIA